MSTTKLNNKKETPEIPHNRRAIAYPFGILNEVFNSDRIRKKLLKAVMDEYDINSEEIDVDVD